MSCPCPSRVPDEVDPLEGANEGARRVATRNGVRDRLRAEQPRLVPRVSVGCHMSDHREVRSMRIRQIAVIIVIFASKRGEAA